uniref:Transmembrane protein n=1 Tax=Leersia perrieri TaxID=77586 RepID=A0A0D9X8Y7_9ORYZ
MRKSHLGSLDRSFTTPCRFRWRGRRKSWHQNLDAFEEEVRDRNSGAPPFLMAVPSVLVLVIAAVISRRPLRHVLRSNQSIVRTKKIQKSKRRERREMS